VVLRKWLRRSILEGREELPPLSRPQAGSAENRGHSGAKPRKRRP